MSRKTRNRRGRRRLVPATRKQLRADVAERDAKLAGAEQLIAGLRLTVEELETEVGKLKAGADDADVLRKRLDAAREANRKLTADNIALNARVEEFEAVTIPVIGARDTTDGLDQATEPIYVQTWRERMERVETAATMPEVRSLADAMAGGTR